MDIRSNIAVPAGKVVSLQNSTSDSFEIFEYDHLSETEALLARWYFEKSLLQYLIYFQHRLSLALFHGVTLLALCFYAYIMHAKIDISHPVFAVIYQEILVLLFSELISFVVVLATGIDFNTYYLPLMLQINVIYFHQWSWFIVTALRHVLYKYILKRY